VHLEPESERVSLLLFRVLWSSGERDLAFEEMKRFLAVGQSAEYSKMLEGGRKPATRCSRSFAMEVHMEARVRAVGARLVSPRFSVGCE